MASSPNSSLRQTKVKFAGLFPATVTPFNSNLELDELALRHHLSTTASSDGVAGLVVNSGIGEILVLSEEEQERCIRVALEVRKPHQLIIAGIQGRSAKELVAAATRAKNSGAGALLVLPPFDIRAYRRLATNPGSVRAVFAELDKVGLPMVVFQYPKATGAAYSLEALLAIADLPNVAAIKAATAGNMEEYVEVWDTLGDKISVLAGVDSPPLLDMLKHGAHGALIGISAVMTSEWGRLLQLVDDRSPAADRLFAEICLPLMEAIFEDQKPTRLSSESAATKAALVHLGEISCGSVRPPALDVTPAVSNEIRKCLADLGRLPAAVAAE